MSYGIQIDKMLTKTINGFDNVVCMVRYTLTWTNDDGNSASQQFPLLLVDPDDVKNYPDTTGFIPYANLTEAQVKSWIENQKVFPNLCKSLQQRIRKPAKTAEESVLPWAQVN